MNRNGLEAEVTRKTKIAPRIVAQVLAAAFTAITESLEKGEKVSQTGFGSFEVRTRAERDGKNPKTGCTIKVRAKQRVVFRPGKGLDEAINGKR